MITLTTLSDNIIKVQVTGTLEESDFQKLGAEIDTLLAQYVSVRLLVDATTFNGWSNMQAATNHFKLVRDHQKRVERIALIAGHAWQHWVAGMMSVFVHPQVKVFDATEQMEAEAWVRERKAA